MPGGTPSAGLETLDWGITAFSSTARDVEMGQSEGFSHMEAFAP